ncbi:MAG: pyridoxal phosphate-dependent aminotransferase [Bacillota bacterium]
MKNQDNNAAAPRYRIPDRLKEISPFIAMEVLEQAKQMELAGEKVIHLEVGEPAGETPAAIKAAALQALSEGETCYTHSMGRLDLREEIARYYRRHYGVEIVPEQVVVTSGSSPAMLLAFSALLDNGDEAVLADPYYACYPNFIRYVGAKPVFARVTEAEGFKLRADNIKKHLNSRTRAVMINSPSNPTGAVLNAGELAEIAALGHYVIADEVYHGINFTGKDHSILEFTDRAVVINGFSKRHIMTGWRLGYVIAPPELARVMQTLQQNLFICACNFTQAAGMAALQEGENTLAVRFGSYNERRLYLYSVLQEMGIAPAVPPEGAFYMLANVNKYSADSFSLAFRILQEAKVAVTPGIDFGPGAEGYIRISYACTMEELHEGLMRLKRFFESYRH